MKIGRMLVMSAAALLLAGCAGPRHGEIASQIPPIEAGNGRIYIYQLAQADGANAAEPAILIDGRKVGRSKPGRFFFVDRPAGAHTLATAHYKRSARPALPVPLKPARPAMCARTSSPAPRCCGWRNRPRRRNRT